MVSAFIFAQVSGSGADVAAIHNALHAIGGVKTVHFVAGPIDIILYVETADPKSLMETVGKIRAVKGVSSTDTRIVLPV
jgi:DNA-binding Lrp family transcriptional regulator